MKKILHKLEITDSTSFWRFCLQFIKFGIIGVSNTIISLAIYYPLIYMGLHYFISNALAFVVSVCNSYYWNNKYVFKTENGAYLRGLIKAFTAYSFTFFLGSGLLFLLIDIIGISRYLAPLLALPVIVPINFMLNKFWTFRNNKNNP